MARTIKLNKSQIWEMVQETINNVNTETTELFKKDKQDIYTNKLINELSTILAAKQGGGASTKVNEDGEVYCNYFKQYFEPSEFATKMSKPNKETGERTEGYKANCRNAETILRKIKALKTNCTNQVINAFSAKTINADEMQKHLTNIDNACAEHYENIEAIPKSMEVLGLTEAMSK